MSYIKRTTSRAGDTPDRGRPAANEPDGTKLLVATMAKQAAEVIRHPDIPQSVRRKMLTAYRGSVTAELVELAFGLSDDDQVAAMTRRDTNGRKSMSDGVLWEMLSFEEKKWICYEAKKDGKLSRRMKRIVETYGDMMEETT